MGNGAVIILIFVLSLFFSSMAISYFNTELNGDISVKTITLPNSLDSYYGSQNYINGSYNTSISDIVGLYNNWVFQEYVGMVHTSIGLLNTNYFLIDNIQKSSSNTVINTYKINNSIKQDYTIVLRYTGSSDENEIIVKSDGLHIPNYFQAFGINLGDSYFISLPNANQITDITIKTNYFDGDDNNDPSGTITFDGTEYTLQNLHVANIVGSNFKTYYGGISSDSIGTTFVSFSSENVIKTTTGGSVVDTLKMIASFITFTFSMLTYSLPETILPLSIQVLVILPQEFMMMVGLAMFIRES
jgi:hypothetical protein